MPHTHLVSWFSCWSVLGLALEKGPTKRKVCPETHELRGEGESLSFPCALSAFCIEQGTFVLVVLNLGSIKPCKTSCCPVLTREELFLDIVSGSFLLEETSSTKDPGSSRALIFLEEAKLQSTAKLWECRQQLPGVSRLLGNIWKRNRSVGPSKGQGRSC